MTPESQLVETNFGTFVTKSGQHFLKTYSGNFLPFEQVIEIIEDVVRHHMDWQEGERESLSKGESAVYSVDHLNAIHNLTSQIVYLGKEMTSIKAKLETST